MWSCLFIYCSDVTYLEGRKSWFDPVFLNFSKNRFVFSEERVSVEKHSWVVNLQIYKGMECIIPGCHCLTIDYSCLSAWWSSVRDHDRICCFASKFKTTILQNFISFLCFSPVSGPSRGWSVTHEPRGTSSEFMTSVARAHNSFVKLKAS